MIGNLIRFFLWSHDSTTLKKGDKGRDATRGRLSCGLTCLVLVWLLPSNSSTMCSVHKSKKVHGSGTSIGEGAGAVSLPGNFLAGPQPLRPPPALTHHQCWPGFLRRPRPAGTHARSQPPWIPRHEQLPRAKGRRREGCGNPRHLGCRSACTRAFVRPNLHLTALF